MTDARIRAEVISEFRKLADDYASDAKDGYGVANHGVELHKLIDRITSEVYGMEFAYCGRTHTVL